MKVKDLVEKLHQMPPDAEVRIFSVEGDHVHEDAVGQVTFDPYEATVNILTLTAFEKEPQEDWTIKAYISLCDLLQSTEFKQEVDRRDAQEAKRVQYAAENRKKFYWRTVENVKGDLSCQPIK